MTRLKRFFEVFAKVTVVLLVVLVGGVGYFYWKSGLQDLAGWLRLAGTYLLIIPVVAALCGLEAVFEALPRKKRSSK